MARPFVGDSFDELNYGEQKRQRQMGFTRGFSVGEETGWRDGYIFGIRKGAQLSAEIGYYQGFSHAWIAILEQEDTSKQRKLAALYGLLEMTRGFPKTNNLLEDDAIQKLARIRAKFKQVNALILGAGGSTVPPVVPSSGGGLRSEAANAARRSKSSVPPPPAPAPAASTLHRQPGVFTSQQQHPHTDSFQRGTSWTSQDSGAGSFKASGRSHSPRQAGFFDHKTEMSF